MKHTHRQTTRHTLTDLYRALDRQHAVTITYLRQDGTETIRTVEPFDVRTTKAGRILIRAMDRATGEARSFYVDAIRAYTLHRSAFVIDRPADTTPTRPAPAHSAGALIAYELNRDTITAALRARAAHDLAA